MRLSAPTWWKRIQSPTWWGAAIVLVGASFGLRVHAVAAPNLTGDEWFMLRNHDQGPLWIIHQAHTFEPHPLAYYLGLASWIEVAGRTEFAMRFPSVAFGALLTAALIALGRQLLGSRIGLIAGLIAAINPYQIAESQNARNYEMVAALSAIASLLFLRALRRGERRDWIRYGVAMFLALNTHYDAALVFGAHIAYFCGRWLLARHSRRGTYDADVGALDRRWLFTTSAVGVAFFVWMLWAWPALAAYHGYFPNPVGIDQVLLRSLATFSLGSVVAISAAVPLFALALVGAAWLIFSRPDRGWFLLLYVLLPIGAVSILFLARPMFDERYLIVLAPGYLVLLAAGIEGLLRRVWPLGILALAAVVALTVPRISQTYASELTDRGDYREMAAWVGTFGTPDDPIVATGHGQAQLFSYYYHGPQPVQIVDQAANVPSVLVPNLNGHAGLWLLPYWDNPVDLAGLDDLGQQAAPVADRWFTGARALYFASPVPLKLDPDLRGTWAGKLSLSGVDVGSGNVTPGDAVAVGLHWTNGASFATPKLSLRLYDTLGAIVAQSDEPLGSNAQLAPGTGVTRIGVFVPPTTPPGSYRLVALLYQPETGQTLPLNASSQQLDGGLVVGAVQVGVRDRPIAPGETGFNPMTPTTFGAVLTALSHDPVDPGARAGDWLSLRVLWRADGPSRPDLARTLVLRDADNHTIASVTTPIVATYPTSKWSTGQLLAERVRLQVPATATSSKNHLYLRVSGDSAHALDLGEVDVTGPTRVFTRPAVPQPDGAGFGSFATLLGTSQLPSSVTPGGTLPLTLIWAASGTPDHSFTAFVHLLDPTGQIQGQIDRPPLNGQRPTDGWVAGEYVQDDYSVPVNAGAPTGKYTIEVGLYDAASGVRVPVVLADGTKADHAVIGTVEVTR